MGVRALKKPVSPVLHNLQGYTQNFWGFYWQPTLDGWWGVFDPQGHFLKAVPTWYDAAEYALPLRPSPDG